MSAPTAKEVATLLSAALVIWVAIYLVFALSGFEVLRSDALGYWRSSLELDRPSVFHLPAHPALVRMAHVALPWIAPAHLMQGVCLLAWLASVAFAFLCLRALGSTAAWKGALAYAAFPFIGAVNSVFPVSDSLASLTLLAAIWAYLRDKPLIVLAAAAVGLLTHKALWPFFAVMMLIGVLTGRIRLWLPIAAGIPLIVHWWLGAQHHEDLLWIIRTNVDVEMSSHGTLPVFDGLLHTTFRGGIVQLAKGLVVLGTFGLAVALAFSKVLRAEPVLLSVVVPVLIFGTVLNQHEIWAMFRFSKFLVLPLWLVLQHRGTWARGWAKPAWAASIVAGVSSQVAFSEYVMRSYFA